MSLELVTEEYSRLKHELACAYEARPWQSSRIDRIADQLAAVERQIISRYGAQGPTGAAQTPGGPAPSAALLD